MGRLRVPQNICSHEALDGFAMSVADREGRERIGIELERLRYTRAEIDEILTVVTGYVE